jgi:transcriptional regulator with XRE-family HTH domain
MSATPVSALGRFIREQRQLAHLSLRELSRLTSVSNAYLSQVERGIHEPSLRVLRALAAALGVPVEEMVRHSDTGVGDEQPRRASVEQAIRGDDRLSGAQKEALLGVLRGFLDGGTTSAPGEGS